jgi:hypothetical protein
LIEGAKQLLALLYLSTPLILAVWIVLRLRARPRLRVRFCALALLAWIGHVVWTFILILPGVSGHWRPTEQESRLIDTVMIGGVIVVILLIVLAARDRTPA